MNRYIVKTMGVKIVDSAPLTLEDNQSSQEFEFSEPQWSTAQLLVRCYAKYGDRVAGIKFLSHQFDLTIAEARVLYDAALEHEI